MGLFKALFKVVDVLAGDEHDWYDTTAVFTGRAIDRENNILDGTEGITPFAYEIEYDSYRGVTRAWHVFTNGETPDLQTLAGTTMDIQYRDDDPKLFRAPDHTQQILTNVMNVVNLARL